ncbi:MAG: hypothetical protein ACK4GR_04245 [bacterium]
MIKIIRIVHGWLGFIFSIFFIITSLTGIVLVFRKEIPKSFKDFVFSLHTYEFGVLKYWAVAVGLALFGLSISGIILFISIYGSKLWKNKKK